MEDTSYVNEQKQIEGFFFFLKFQVSRIFQISWIVSIICVHIYSSLVSRKSEQIGRL